MISTRVKLTLSLTVVSTVLGFMISLQYRQQLDARSGVVSYSASDTEQKKLLSQLNALKESNNKAQAELASLTTQISSYERVSAGSDGTMREMQGSLSAERILAGITPVSGPGVKVTLMDGAASNGNVENYLTHDWDVRTVINELFTAGAEAVSINGYRVVATSGVFCTGPVVRVNDHRIGAPFTIEAIGDPQTLKSALTIQGGILDNLRARGVNVADPQEAQVIQMPPFTGSTQPTS